MRDKALTKNDWKAVMVKKGTLEYLKKMRTLKGFSSLEQLVLNSVKALEHWKRGEISYVACQPLLYRPRFHPENISFEAKTAPNEEELNEQENFEPITD